MRVVARLLEVGEDEGEADAEGVIVVDGNGERHCARWD